MTCIYTPKYIKNGRIYTLVAHRSERVNFFNFKELFVKYDNIFTCLYLMNMYLIINRYFKHKEEVMSVISYQNTFIVFLILLNKKD